MQITGFLMQRLKYNVQYKINKKRVTESAHLKFLGYKYIEEKLYYLSSENKGADQICAFVFAYAKIWFSDDAAHLV